VQEEKEAGIKAYVSDLKVADEKAKPRLLALLFCDHINQTKGDKVNLIGVFDRIYVPPDDKRTPVIALFLRLAETLEGPITVSIFDPENKPALAFQIDGNPEQFALKDRPREYPKQIQAILPVQFTVSMEGLFWFDVSYHGKSLGGAGIPIEYLKEGVSIGTDTFV